MLRSDLFASGDIILASAENRHMDAYASTRKRTFSASMSARGQGSITQAGSEVSGNNVTMHAGNNVLIAASGVTAKNDLSLKADTGDVMVIAGQDQWYDYNESKKTKFHLAISPPPP